GGIGLDPHGGINQATAGGDIEFPQMPGAADDLALALDVVAGSIEGPARWRRGGDDASGHPTGTERPRLVGADVAQCVIVPGDIEDAYTGPAPKRDNNSPVTGRKCLDTVDADGLSAVGHRLSGEFR